MARHNNNNSRGAKAPSQRQLRVGEEIRHALSEIVRRAPFRDPVLADCSVTITEARVSPDLRNATVFVMPLGGEAEPIVEALNRASAFLRGQLAEAVRLRHMPRLAFVRDESFDEASRIDALLHSEAVARDLRAPDATDDDPETVDPDTVDRDT